MKNLFLALIFAAGLSFVGCQTCETCTVTTATTVSVDEYCGDDLDDGKAEWDADTNTSYVCVES